MVFCGKMFIQNFVKIDKLVLRDSMVILAANFLFNEIKSEKF